jgi:hypothetical protein
MRKSRSIKDRIREQRKRNRRITLAIILIALVSVSGFITYLVLNQSSSGQTVSIKAAIVDQLSGTFPNPSFKDNATTILVGAGYTVDYYLPDQVTVDFFRTLPLKGYGVVIIRAHSTGWMTGNPITIFTSEFWRSDKYVYEQLIDRLGSANLYPTLPRDQRYFVITSSFVRETMQGRFPNSVIVMMGCTGLKDSEMAKAFVSKGASIYVSWDNSVTADRTDNATIALLRSLAKGKTVKQALNTAMDEAGPDPVYHSQLGFYPDTQAALVLSMQHNAMMANVRAASETSPRRTRT